MIKLAEIKSNPNNPRLIKDDKFKLLCERIQSNPNTLKYRPIVIDVNNIIQAGNMRFKALKELGYKEVPDEWIVKADDLTDEQMREFVVVDNVGYGEWDYELLKNQYSAEELSDWGVDVPVFDEESNEDFDDKSSQIKSLFKIEVECKDEQEQEVIYNKLIEQGLSCRLLTL
jgi:ParB-like chromosome segregation protein Spo0J